MPRTNVDYSKTIIYKIVCNDLNVTDVYVGNTTNFTKRKNAHKRASINENNNCYNYKVYQIIRQNGGWDNWNMIEIEKYCCKDSNEASARERYYYETLNAKLNTKVPNRSMKECLTNYRQTHKQQAQQKYNCECGSVFTHSHKSEHIKTKKHQNYINSLVNEDNII